MRVLFAGSPEMAVPSLVAAARSHRVVGVLTNPDRGSGRGRKTEESPVKAAAKRLGLPVLQPEKLDAAARLAVQNLAPDILAVVAYGRIFGPRFLALFPRGGINLHPSLLPRHRGPTPINAAILAGDRETGITVQRLALRMDAGDILLQERIPLSGRETAGSLTALAADKGAPLLVRALDLIARGEEAGTPQREDEASYCGLLTRESGRIDWTREAAHIERMARAYNPWPGAWTLFRGETLRILAAGVPETREVAAAEGPPPGKVLGVDKSRGILVQTGGGLLAVTELGLQSRRAMDFRSFLNGNRDFIGSVLGEGK